MACDIPHLAKNERDMGHPAIFCGDREKLFNRQKRSRRNAYICAPTALYNENYLSPSLSLSRSL